VLRASREGLFTWKNYLFQRLTRLWIVLLPALLLGWAMDQGGMHLFHSPQNLYSGPTGQEDITPGLASRSTVSIFLGNALFLQGIRTPMFGTNVSLWSLSYEFWFYILFPLLVTLVLASSRAWNRAVSGVILLVLIPMLGWQISAYFVIWLFGATIAILPLGLSANRRRLLRPVAAALLLASLVGLLKYPFDLYLSDLILGTAFSLLLWTILHAGESTVSGVYRAGARTLSNMSYTLYLVHMPCFVLLSAALMPVWNRWPLSVHSVLMLLGVYGIVFVVASLMYYVFERNTAMIRSSLLSYM